MNCEIMNRDEVESIVYDNISFSNVVGDVEEVEFVDGSFGTIRWLDSDGDEIEVCGYGHGRPIKSSRYYIEYYAGGTDNGYVRYDNRPTIDLDNAMIFDSEQEANEWIDDHSDEWKATLKVVPYPDFDEIESSRKPIKSGRLNVESEALEKVKQYGGKRINSKPIEILEILDDGEYSAFLEFTFKSGNDVYEMVYDYGFGGKKDKPSIKKIESSRRLVKSGMQHKDISNVSLDSWRDGSELPKKNFSNMSIEVFNQDGDEVFYDFEAKQWYYYPTHRKALVKKWVEKNLVNSSRKITSARVNELTEQEKDDLYEIEKNEAEEHYNSLDDSDKQMLRARYGIKNVKDYVKFFIVHPNKLSDDYEFIIDPRTKLNSRQIKSGVENLDKIKEFEKRYAKIKGDVDKEEDLIQYYVGRYGIPEETLDEIAFNLRINSSRQIKSARYVATDPETGEVLGSADTYDEAIEQWGEDVTITDSKVARGQEETGLFQSRRTIKSGKNKYGADIDRIYEKQLNRIKELRAKGYSDDEIDDDEIVRQTKEDMKNVGKIKSSLSEKFAMSGYERNNNNINKIFNSAR